LNPTDKKEIIIKVGEGNAGGSLDAWHLSQFFGAAPTLSEGFIQDNPPFDRVVAVPAEPHFIFDCYFKLICARPMPASEPTFIFDCYFKLICARPLPTYGVPGGMSNF
jgi:hypothetical protein